MKKIKYLLLLVVLFLCQIKTYAGNKITATTSTFVDIYDTQALDGDTILLDAGIYSTAINFPTGKSITIKASSTALTQPVLSFQIGEPTGEGGSLTFIGLSINRGGDYLYSTSTTYNIGSLKFYNCKISNIAKSLFNTSASGGTMSSLVIDNCIISSCGTSSTNFITMYYTLGSMTLSNTTVNNFLGGNFFNTKQSTVGSGLVVSYINNTIYKSIANNGWGMCSIEGGGYSGATYTFNNNIFDGAAASVSPRLIYTKTGGIVNENNNIINGYQSDYIQGTNTITRNNLTLGSGILTGVTSIPYNSASTGDFSIPETSPIATAGQNRVCVGDPRWIVKVSTPATVSATVFPAAAGSATPASLTVNVGDKVNVSTTANFGYHFVNWTDANNNIVSTEASFQYTLSEASSTLRANYSAVQTYSLDCGVKGGANAYMLSVSPAGNMVNGKRMYETGTIVTLTATNNSILRFSNWTTGETSSELTFTMDKNRTDSAVYSATDYIAGWDFYNAGGQSRIADFYSTANNSTASLIMRKADGTTNSWLDKSTVAAAGYYGNGAAVNWKYLTDQYYFQVSFDATEFQNISIQSSLLLNYNGYSKQIVQYSTDNVTFTPLHTVSIPVYRVWQNDTVNLPSSVNNAARVYVRWIPDYSSPLVGVASDYDGTAISNIYILGSVHAPADAIAPVLVSTVPTAAATNASTTGSVVLNFDEKIQLVSLTTKATLNSKQLTPTVSGKTLIFPYSGLDYNTQYTFTLPANSVQDLNGNALVSDVLITFTTMARPMVTKKLFDFVVGVDGDFKAALAAATTASSTGSRYRIFFPNGQYNIGSNTGDANQMTTIALPNVSYVGQSKENVVLYNQNSTEGMSVTATLNFTSAANNLYIQDVTIKNGDFRSGVASIGRCLALFDSGTKNIYKNVNVLSNQDTYFSGSGRKYFEGGSIHGTVDYIFGGGDVYFNECQLYMEGSGYVCAPNTTTDTKWGYVFNNCTIDGATGTNGNYHLGRPWQNSPKAAFLNTTMKVLPVAEGWSDWYTAPSIFAEYNSLTSSGSAVDLTMRRTTYQTSVVLNPVLTPEQASTYTVENVLSGSDAWNPKLYTDQAAVPSISGNGSIISWGDNNYVLCWAVFKDGIFQRFVTTNSYLIPVSVTSGEFTVRAANEMGGLSAVSNSYNYSNVHTNISNTTNEKIVAKRNFYTLDGSEVLQYQHYHGIMIVKTKFTDGSVETTKMLNNSGK